MTWLAVILGVLFLLMSAVDVAPAGQSTHNLVCLSLAAAAFAAATLAAVLRGVKRARGVVAGQRAAWKRLVVRIVFCLLPFAGIMLLSAGHAYQVRAKERAARQELILAREGHFSNPYWEYQAWCDCLGLVCLAGCGVWGYLKIVERVSCRIVRNRL